MARTGRPKTLENSRLLTVMMSERDFEKIDRMIPSGKRSEFVREAIIERIKQKNPAEAG